MDAFVRACERRGYAPAVYEKSTGLKLTVLGQVVVVGLVEKTKKQQPRPRTDWEERGFKRGWYRSQPYTLVPTGVLALQIRRNEWVSYELRERPEHPLEESLGRFMTRV